MVFCNNKQLNPNCTSIVIGWFLKMKSKMATTACLSFCKAAYGKINKLFSQKLQGWLKAISMWMVPYKVSIFNMYQISEMAATVWLFSMATCGQMKKKKILILQYDWTLAVHEVAFFLKWIRNPRWPSNRTFLFNKSLWENE